MATQQQIMELASSLIGAERIVDPAQGHDGRSRRIIGLYPIIYEQCLSVWPWACARGRRLLTRMEEEPEWGFNNQFALPGETLTVQAAMTGGLAWEVEQRHLLSDWGAEKLAVITTDRVSETLLHPKVAEYISVKLAFAAAMGVSDSTTLQERLYKIVGEAFLEAAHADNTQGSSLDKLTSGWVMAMQTAYAPEDRIVAASDVSGLLQGYAEDA